MSDSKKQQSQLVKTVLQMDEHLSELERIGAKITSMDMKSEFEFEHAQKLLMRFAECGQDVSDDVSKLAVLLNESRERAEKIAAGVAACADQVRQRKSAEEQKLAEFNQLGEKVRALSSVLADLRKPAGETLSREDRAKLSVSLGEIEGQLNPLIEHAQRLRSEAREAKMKNLEQNADSLTQTLQSIQQKISTLNFPHLMQ